MDSDRFNTAGNNVFESEVKQVCDNSGASLQELIDVDVKLLHSKKPLVKTVKGRFDKRRKLPDYVHIIGETTLPDLETVLLFDFDDNGSQNKASDRLHRLCGNFPAEKHELSGNVTVKPEITPEDRELVMKLHKQVVDAIIRDHRRKLEAESRAV